MPSHLLPIVQQVEIAVAAAARLLLLGYCPAVAVPTVIVRVCVCVPLDFGSIDAGHKGALGKCKIQEWPSDEV